MKWIELTSEQQIAEIREKSAQRPQVIFKHSTRCGISAVAKSRLDKWQPTEDFDFYYLDLIKNRNLSNLIATEFHVYHESPQVLLIKGGACVYDESHTGIHMHDIVNNAGVI